MKMSRVLPFRSSVRPVKSNIVFGDSQGMAFTSALPKDVIAFTSRTGERILQASLKPAEKGETENALIIDETVLNTLKAQGRKALIGQILWKNMDPPVVGGAPLVKRFKDIPAEDLPFIVLVGGPPGKYTLDDLAKLAWFSKRVTENYDKTASCRLGGDLIEIDMVDTTFWIRKKQSWTQDKPYSTYINQALGVFAKELGFDLGSEKS